ncbi:MAG: serine/threonine protein kinase [Rhodospirillaceae bacterium]|jgi:HPr kinase/phosphorylase|nr:serine/threonine protein kinase [Rhodospirillaceae bacterium]MBT5666564.1 serine/threonine protein kinase [Rhodospirillaceae bacterium]
METVHGTTVVLDGVGVLLRGRPGSGKSDLALRLIDGGACLVADDQTVLERCGDRLEARAPKTLRNKIEIRGIGVVTLPQESTTPSGAIGLVVDLVESPDAVARMPVSETVEISGVVLRCLRLWPFEASAAAKVRLAIRTAPDDIEGS